MAGKNTVWVVEQGTYSDYRVVGVFSEKEYAQLIADAINTPAEGKYSDDATIVEWPLDPAVHELRQGFVQFTVLMHRDGTTPRGVSKYLVPHYISGRSLLWQKSGQNPADAMLFATVWAKDEAHAVKIVNEHRTRMIASGEWAGETTEGEK